MGEVAERPGASRSSLPCARRPPHRHVGRSLLSVGIRCQQSLWRRDEAAQAILIPVAGLVGMVPEGPFATNAPRRRGRAPGGQALLCRASGIDVLARSIAFADKTGTITEGS